MATATVAAVRVMVGQAAIVVAVRVMVGQAAATAIVAVVRATATVAVVRAMVEQVVLATAMAAVIVTAMAIAMGIVVDAAAWATTVIWKNAKCTRLPVPIAVLKPKYLLHPVREFPFSAERVIIGRRAARTARTITSARAEPRKRGDF